MNPMFVATFLCLATFAASHAIVPTWGHGVYNVYGGAPIGADGRVVDTVEVAHAKAAHAAAVSAASNGAYAAPSLYAAHGAWAPAAVYGGVYAHGAAPLGQDGRVVDTVEVSHAKIANVAAFNNAARENSVGSHASWGVATHGAWAPAVAYGGAYAHGLAPLGQDGRVVDTVEVAHAKIANVAAFNNAARENSVGSAASWGVGAHGVIAAPIVLAHGAQYVQDTPEVAQAKVAHFAAHAAAAHHGAW